MVSYKSLQISVVGINVGRRLKAIQTLNEGNVLQHIREPENPFDKNAIKVYTKEDREIKNGDLSWPITWKLDFPIS
ncbi:hypothetical protein JNUCC31_32915 [Paenibacillus sp. JNUCC31]|uniref:HIRAN domain-containing protein n=1 Tax=Paenibacillus sp. JNUCC-31 TaxID=2777983 RepID=UPI00177E6CB1|nr:HIRAN domain-containing protein [Paenibacillus sp. JNUCC-31]QOS79385.1 hypothetical protein JNUCC31_32915 [Paenibacillus sp. JNUCC-31]